MGREKKYYLLSWILMVAAFNLVCFITPEELHGVSKFSGPFWPCYGIITAAFLIHAIFAWNMLPHAEDTPIVAVSALELLIMAIAGSACLALPILSFWVGVIICVLILIFSILFILLAKRANRKVMPPDDVLADSDSIRDSVLRAADRLLEEARGDDAKALALIVHAAVSGMEGSTDRKRLREIQALIGELSDLMADDAETDTLKSKVSQIMRLARN